MTTNQTNLPSAQVITADGPLPVLWLCGAPGSGKSATAWELFSAHQEEQIAYVDIDQLKMLAPGPSDPFDLAVANLVSLVAIHRSLGTQALIVSGVIDLEQLPILEAGVAGKAVVTWCLVDSDDETLRRRIQERGWPEELVDLALADAQAWRAAPLAARIDTSVTTPADAARAADALLAPRSTTTSRAFPEPELGDRTDLVVIHGPRAVGKSTISWGLFMDCAGSDEPTGYLDADQLGFIHADAAVRDRLILRAVASMAQNFADAGAVRTIVNGNLTPAVVASLQGSRVALVQLDAPQDVLAARIAARNEANSARLTGDDLMGATSDTRTAVLEHALRQREEYAASDFSARVVDTSDADPDGHVRTIRALLTRTGTGSSSEPPATGIDHGACCVIITGAPASGKSTLTRRLAEQLERSAWLNGDQIHSLVVGGRVWALGEPKDEAQRQTRLGNHNLITLAKNCAEAGFTPVIDWIIPDGEQLAQFVEGLAPLPLWLIALDPGAEACRERNLQRNDPFAFDGYDELIGEMKRAFGSTAWWIASTDQSPDETLRLILAKAHPSHQDGSRPPEKE
ncbi:AAA family ATPase [Tessaracoccus caeni]|uniref:AAA family ATPase n=1 Tax=Tessaracoccus caeni TaxID=3031239 RepID=UPI0023DA1A3B|nr:AAA family ATPase [Tessaracoccus caeni]MDF1489447.1 AAA family ATPase [Tessaracoccus caeni]